MTPERDETRATPSGIWVAFYPDASSLVVFAEEVEALRYAVDHKMDVRFVEWGQELRP